MRSPSRLLPLVAFVALGCHVFATGDERGRPLIQRYSAKEYRGHYQVWSATQTPDGAMWFGSLNGVLEFDGAVWRHHAVPTSFVRQTVVGKDGMLYVAGEEAFGRLEHRPDGTVQYRSLLDS